MAIRSDLNALEVLARSVKCEHDPSELSWAWHRAAEDLRRRKSGSAREEGSSNSSAHPTPSGSPHANGDSQSVGVDRSSHRGLSQTAKDEREDWDWCERLEICGRDLGWRAELFHATAAVAADTAAPSHPVVTRLNDGRWVIIVDHRGGSVKIMGEEAGQSDVSIGTGRWISMRRLHKLLDASPRASRRWVVIQSLISGDGHSHAPHHGNGHGHHAHGMPPLWRLMGLMRPEWADIKTIAVFAVAVAVLSLATPLAIEAVVSTVAMSLLAQQLTVLVLILLGCLALAAAIQALQAYIAEIIQRRLFVRIAGELAERLPRVQISAYDRAYGPELVNRFFDVLTVQKVVALMLLDGLGLVVSAFIGLAVVGFYSPLLLAFSVGLLLVTVLAVFVLGRGGITTQINESIAKYEVASQLEDLSRAPLAHKAAGLHFALERVDARARNYLDHREAHFRILIRQIVFSLSFQATAMAAVLGLGGFLVIQEQLTLGQLVATELIIGTLVGSLAKLGTKHIEAWYDLMAAVDKLGHLFDLPLERSDGAVLPLSAVSTTEAPTREQVESQGLRATPAATPGVMLPRPAALRIRDVSFAYEGRPPVLKGVNLALEPGERVALVGRGGSGKSTLAELLFGLREPRTGVVELDGFALSDLRLDTIREHVALARDLEALEGTVLDNVKLGRNWVDLEAVRDALDRVGLHDDLTTVWSEGLYLTLSSSGAPLAKGQLRRLTLARALAGQPRLLVIDETLDGLDIETRAPILEMLTDRSNPWTLLVITHDADVAAACDRVVTLDQGRVILDVDPQSDQAPRRRGSSRLELEGWLNKDQ